MKGFLKEVVKTVVKAATETFVTEAARHLAERYVGKKDPEPEPEPEEKESTEPSEKPIQ